MTKYVVITSGKGGTGKTTTAINLGTALAQFSRDSIVVDGSLAMPNIAIQLGSANLPRTIHDAISGTKNIRETAYSHPSGLKIIPASINREIAEVHTLKEVLRGLEGTTELVIIDSAPGLGKEAMQAIDAADEAILVTNPEMTAITEALKTIKRIKKEGKGIMGIVLNKVSGHESDLTKENVEQLLGHRIIGVIEEDVNVRNSLKQNHPVTYLYPNSKASIGYKKLAAELIGEEYKESLKKEGFLTRIWQNKN